MTNQQFDVWWGTYFHFLRGLTPDNAKEGANAALEAFDSVNKEPIAPNTQQ